MNTIGSVPPPTFQSVPTHSPLGKPVVGIEAADAPLPPVEETAATDELRHRDVVAKLRDDDARRDQQNPHDQPDPEQTAQQQLEEQLASVAQRAAQTAPITPLPAAYQAKHLAEFEPHSLPPGSLLDQQV